MALAARDRLGERGRAEASARLADFAEALGLADGASVAGFWPIGSEIDPRPLMERLLARGHRLALPVVLDDRETMIFRAWRPGDPLEPSRFGLSVPPATVAAVDPDVLLMPLAAFDRAGERIGWGKGHYDRALARMEARVPRRKIGLAFSVQEVAGIPAEPHDRRLDLLLTELGPIVPGGDRR